MKYGKNKEEDKFVNALNGYLEREKRDFARYCKSVCAVCAAGKPRMLGKTGWYHTGSACEVKMTRQQWVTYQEGRCIAA